MPRSAPFPSRPLRTLRAGWSVGTFWASLLLLALSGLSVGQPVAWGQHSWRSGISNWGGLNLVGPGGQFTMYQGPVGGWPMFAPQPLPWGFPAGPVVYAPGYSAWGPGVIVAGPMGWSTAPAWPVGPLAVDPRDLGFGHHPPELPPLAPAPQVDRLRRLPLAEDLAKRAVPALPAGPAGAGVQPVAPGALPPQDEQAQPPQDNPPLFLKASNAEQRRRSLRAQAQGDEQFRKLQFLPAVGRYRQAAEAAADLSEPRLRLAWALVALGEFGQGVEHLQRGLRLDPDWAAHGPGLSELLGPGQQLAAETILHRVAGWVRADIRDPDRLLLLGVLLHFREDAAQAREVLTTAAALAGEASTARQFLGSVDRLAQRSAPRPPVEANAGTVMPDPRAPSRPDTPPPGGRAFSPAAGSRETPSAPSATPALPATPLDPAPVPNPPEAESPAAQLEQSRTTSPARGVAPTPARPPGRFVRNSLPPPELPGFAA